jgi:phosphinothricin acetyltransferase
MEFIIREMEGTDWAKVSEIYVQGIETNVSTFETKCPTYEEWDKAHAKVCRYVITDNENILGWAALTIASGRCVYSGVAELSIYIDNRYKGKGVGSKLLAHLINESENHGFWTIQSGIMEENEASIKLHEKCGFRRIGFREKVGKDRYGKWRNTVLMEKRSKLEEYN